ncbi:MAG: hypothetical protein EXR78_09430 [Deltaproteobacteria bacterium]|nr:hypothetical protein [Deltaproteobacteria bacterium]
MKYDEQRRLGIELAKAAGLPKTQGTIESESCCFDDILKTALAEGGTDALVSYVLQGPPEWAYQTLRYVPVGAHREALLAKAAEAPEWALRAFHFAQVRSQRSALLKSAGMQELTTISGMSLFNDGGYVAQWTLNWIHGGSQQPNQNYGNWNDWKWSDRLNLGQGSGRIDLTKFVLPKAPLASGDECWMYVWVQAGNDMQSMHFIYDPQVSTTANYVCSGTTTSEHLGLQG